MDKKYGRDLTQGSIPRHLLNVAMPMMLGNLIQTSYSIVNAIWVGRICGKDALGAVAVTTGDSGREGAPPRPPPPLPPSADSDEDEEPEPASEAAATTTLGSREAAAAAAAPSLFLAAASSA